MSEDASHYNFVSYNSRLMKRAAVTDSKFVPENISLNAQINIIPYANEMEKDKKMMRKPTVIAIKETNDDVSTQENLNMDKHHTAQNLVFIEKKVDDEGNEVLFDQDFILCTVFGYKNVYIKEGDDIFEIFIPVKRNHYDEQHAYTQNLLNGYRSVSDEFTQSEFSSEESPKLVSNRRISIDTSKYSTIAPRGFIRKKTKKNLDVLHGSQTYSEDETSPIGRLRSKQGLKALEIPANPFENKRKSEFDQFLKIDEINHSNKLVDELMSVKKKKRLTTSPKAIAYNESFKRGKFRFVAKKMSTQDLKNDTESIQEESKLSSRASVRKREQNISLQRLVSVEEKEVVSPSVQSNAKYIENLKGGKYLKNGLLGKILNLQMKKKLGVQFIEANNIVGDNSSSRQYMLGSSPRFSDDLDNNSVSSVDSSSSEFNTEEKKEQCSDEDSESSYNTEESSPNEVRRAAAPGVFIHKLDSNASS